MHTKKTSVPIIGFQFYPKNVFGMLSFAFLLLNHCALVVCVRYILRFFSWVVIAWALWTCHKWDPPKRKKKKEKRWINCRSPSTWSSFVLLSASTVSSSPLPWPSFLPPHCPLVSKSMLDPIVQTSVDNHIIWRLFIRPMRRCNDNTEQAPSRVTLR